MFIVICDSCESTEDIDTDDFYDALDYLKGEDYLVTKRDGEWKHYCSDCRSNGDY